MGNGGVNYGEDQILFCAQGSRSLPSGLYTMSAHAPYTVTLLPSSFHGREFNSVNNVVIHSDGSIWFTDPPHGFEQGYRPKPKLPSQVYRYNPKVSAPWLMGWAIRTGSASRPMRKLYMSRIQTGCMGAARHMILRLLQYKQNSPRSALQLVPVIVVEINLDMLLMLLSIMVSLS